LPIYLLFTGPGDDYQPGPPPVDGLDDHLFWRSVPALPVDLLAPSGDAQLFLMTHLFGSIPLQRPG
jgi:hypothetical protein